MLLLIALLAATSAQAKGKLDIHRCNGLAGRAGVGSNPGAKEKPYYRISESGRLEFAHNPRTALLGAEHGKSKDELSYFEYHPKGDTLTFGSGIGEHGVLKVALTLQRNKQGEPALLETKSTWYAFSPDETWDRRKKTLASRPPKANERTHETQSWVRYGFSGERCFVSQEGGAVKGRNVVTFDQVLCNRVLRLTDRDPVDLLHDYREGTTFQKSDAYRVFRLIRDEQVARDESLKGEKKRLLAVNAPPEHLLPGTLPPEDSSALQELRACIAALGRNGLKRPAALSKENLDFMGSEPQSGELEPNAAGLPPPQDDY